MVDSKAFLSDTVCELWPKLMILLCVFISLSVKAHHYEDSGQWGFLKDWRSERKQRKIEPLVTWRHYWYFIERTAWLHKCFINLFLHPDLLSMCCFCYAIYGIIWLSNDGSQTDLHIRPIRLICTREEPHWSCRFPYNCSFRLTGLGRAKQVYHNTVHLSHLKN